MSPSCGSRSWQSCRAALAKAVRWGIAWRGMLAGSLLVAGLAQAQDAPPAHWVAYARATGHDLQERLSMDAGDLVERFHQQLALRTQGGAPLPLVVQVWISPHGAVERTAFESLGDVQADADLRAILASKRLQSPPPDMRQPLVLRLTLQPNPDHPATQVPPGPAGAPSP